MSSQFRILLVEDVPADAELILRALKRARMDCIARRVDTAEAYLAELKGFDPDVILSDFSMPQFDGMDALRIARESFPEIPFIFVSGTLGEELAIRALKDGAADFVLKNNLLRLPAAVERATREAEERRTRQEMERELRESEKRYLSLFQNNPHPMWVYDTETLRFLAVNDTAVARYGFSREEFLAMTIKDIRPEQDLPRFLQHVAEPLPGVNTPRIWRHRIKSGEVIEVEISSHEFVMDGRAARMVVAHDVTRRIRAEEALRESERRLDLALGASGLATWEWTLSNQQVQFSHHWWPILGYGPHEIPSLASAWEGLTHPEDLGRVTEAVAAVLRGQEPLLDVEYRMRAKNAEWRWVHSVGRVVERDARGHATRLTGTHGDVTARHEIQARMLEAQMALQEQTAGLQRAQVLAKLAHVITGPGGSFVKWSESLPELIGVDTARMPTSTRAWLDLLHQEDREKFRSKSIEAAKTGMGTELEYRLWRRDGELIHIRQVIEPFSNMSRGREEGLWFCTMQDVTEQVRAEERIKRLNRVHAVLSGINSAIVRIRDRQELFEEACRIAVEEGRFSLGWVGVLDPASGNLLAVAHRVIAAGARADMDFPDRLAGLIPAGLAETALVERRPVFDNHLGREWADAPLTGDTMSVRRTAVGLGAKSAIVLPLYAERRILGLLTLYAPEQDFFDDEELKLLTELAADISLALDIIASEEKVEYLAYYDPLTGLPNRSLFIERLNQHLNVRADEPGLVAVVEMDVVRLRVINDSLNRDAGDDLLRQIARRMEKNAKTLRWSDAARVTADNFAVILRGIHEANEIAQRVKEGMNAIFDESFTVGGEELRIDARAGIAVYPLDGSTSESLIQRAEVALRKAKQTKERFVFFAPEMTARVAETLALETKLRNALNQQQFVLHYQPKFNVATGKMAGVEALIRWNDPESGLVPPLKFIPILEETGMIFEVGRWALRQALEDQQAWRNAELPDLRVAVNVSAQQLRDPHFVEDVQTALSCQEGRAPSLELEITESLLMDDIERNIERLKTIRKLGVTMAIDDFGTGYSSLNYLARLPMDTLKIDRSFVMGMTRNQEGRSIVSAVISLAHSLGLKVVAEGVETQDQLDLLRVLRCDELQGYLLSAPVPSTELARLARQ